MSIYNKMNAIGRGISVIAGVSVLGFTVYVGGNAILSHAEPQQTPPQVQVAMNVEKVTAPAVTTPAPAATFVATAAAGKKLSRKCAACHTFTSGGKNKVGPNLFEVVNRDIASKEGFKYSAAFKERKGSLVWTAENLQAYLKSPRKFIPGNKMAFAGLKKEKDLANILAWLETLK